MEKPTGKIYEKMAAIMGDLSHVSKDGTNAVQNFKFRSIENFINTLHPIMVKHGVFLTMDCIDRKEVIKDIVRGNGKAGIDVHSQLIMKYTFNCFDGSSVSATVPSYGIDSSDKSTNKAMAAALKYCLMQCFIIPTEAPVLNDPDFESPELGVPVNTNAVAKATPEVAAQVASTVETKPDMAQAMGAPAETSAPKKPSSFRKPKASEQQAQPKAVTSDGW